METDVTSAASPVRRKLEEMEREHQRSREKEERLHKEVRNLDLWPTTSHVCGRQE